MESILWIFGVLIGIMVFILIALVIGSYITARFLLPWFNWLDRMYYDVWNEEFKAKHEHKGDKG